MNALVIDDSTAMRKILRRIMEGLSYSVFEADQGQHGLDALETMNEVEIILVDWNMPVMDGLEFVKVARANPRFRETKIMMVTTETDPARMARALMSGVDEFVMKPFTSDVLLEKMKLLGVSGSFAR